MQYCLFQQENNEEIAKILESMAGIYEGQKIATGKELSLKVKAWIAHKQNSKFSEAEYLGYLEKNDSFSEISDLPF